MKKLIRTFLIITALVFAFKCDHENKCKTFYEHKRKLITLPPNE